MIIRIVSFLLFHTAQEIEGFFVLKKMRRKVVFFVVVVFKKKGTIISWLFGKHSVQTPPLSFVKRELSTSIL